jgi:hypothetical protein
MTDDVDAVRAAREQLIAAGSARIDCTVEHTWTLPEFPAEPGRARVRPAVFRAGKAVGRVLCRVLTRRTDYRQQTAAGVIDFAGRRSMIDYGHYAELQIGDQLWSGRSGRPVSTLPPSAARVGSPLWLVDLLGGITSAEDLAIEARAEPWRHLTMITNLAEASRQAPAGLASPARDKLEGLFGLRVEVWLDDTQLRKVRFTDDYRIATVTFSDVGTDVEGLDWDRLPTFRSPEEQRESERHRTA